MINAFDAFEWTVAPSYDWRDWLDQNGRRLDVPRRGLLGMESAAQVEFTWARAQKSGEKFGPVLAPASSSEGTWRRYNPMSRAHSALFKEFSLLDYRDMSAIAGFASKYGSLGLPFQSQSVRFKEKGEWRDHFAHGEPYLGWALEICLMREAVRTADRKKSKDDIQRFKWLFDRNLQHVQGRLAFGKTGEPRLALEPLTLISAMWLQLAFAISGEKRFIACKFCRRMFEISTDETGFRSHREFCSDSCKTKDYRKRKRTALRLLVDGLGVREVADKTGTDAATVRAWLAKSLDVKKGRT